jgi:hypothetical protein
MFLVVDWKRWRYEVPTAKFFFRMISIMKLPSLSVTVFQNTRTSINLYFENLIFSFFFFSWMDFLKGLVISDVKINCLVTVFAVGLCVIIVRTFITCSLLL